MNLISVDLILIPPNRQRREFDPAELSKLGVSIRETSLLHPVVLREEEGAFWLVAGERRVRAVSDLYATGEVTAIRHDNQEVAAPFIPYVTLGELDELAREEAELEENVCRRDLTWQELAAATARLSTLRTKQAEAKGLPPPTTTDLAVEIHGATEGRKWERTRNQLIVSKHLADPEIAGAKTLDDAVKTIKRKEETARRVQLAADVGRTYTAESAHRVEHTSALDWFTQCGEGIFDVICTDPPYGINADEFGDSGGKAAGAHFYEDSYDNWKTLITALAKEGFRITKPLAHLYCFCDITRFEELKSILAEAGWSPFRTPIVWHKPNGSRTPWVDGGPQRQHELVCYARKGNKPVTRIYSDVVSYPTDKNLGHPAQKPVAVYTDLLRRSVCAGDSILDPFGGSGPLLPAANELKCKATVIEADPAAYALCTERLKGLMSTPELAGLV